MNNIVDYTVNTQLNTGDLLYRTKACVEHVGVYYKNGLVAHNSPDNNAEIVTLDKFANRLDIKVKSNNFSSEKQLEIINSIDQIIKENETYNPIINNCEHFVTKILNALKNSDQLKSAVLGCCIGYCYSLFNGSKNVLATTLFTGGLSLILTNSARKYDYKIKPFKKKVI